MTRQTTTYTRGRLLVDLVNRANDKLLDEYDNKSRSEDSHNEDKILRDHIPHTVNQIDGSTEKTREWIEASNFHVNHDKLQENSHEREHVPIISLPEEGHGSNKSKPDNSAHREEESYISFSNNLSYQDLKPVPMSVDVEEASASRQATISPPEHIEGMAISAILAKNPKAAHAKKCNADSCSCSIIAETDLEEITDDDDRDADFNINDYVDNLARTVTSSDTMSEDSPSTIYSVVTPHVAVYPNVQQNKTPLKGKTKKHIRCQYCHNDIVSKNFVRHLERHHKDEPKVKIILDCPTNSKQRRHQLSLLRNDTNFDLFINEGTTRPVRQLSVNSEHQEYVPCSYCKGLFLRNYLRRHGKSCYVKVQTTLAADKNAKMHHLANSQTLTACAMDPTDVISKMNIKNQVFNLMKPDEIAFEAKKDLLIAHMGETYLKKHKKERLAYCASNKMRELSRLLITFRKLTNDGKITFKDTLHPRFFDTVVHAARIIAGYDEEKKTFQAPSLAMHLGTSLKFACDELIHLIIRQSKGFTTESSSSKKEWLTDVKFFKELVESRWNAELASLANKDMMEKRWSKPLLLPMVSDIKKFRDSALEIAHGCRQELSNTDENVKAYKLLVQCTLALLIVFNRRRIGDVQYLKIKDYRNDKRSDYRDFENALTEGEKALTTQYRRVLNSGKGSRAVVILVPKLLQQFIDVILEHRVKYIPDPENDYLFALPGSTIKWGKGDVAIKTICKQTKLEQCDAISSNKLRKHIATVMQILNLDKDDAKQFAKFMGHTEKTHEEFYSLPVDIYQTAKVSKLLLMIEKGNVPIEYKGKSLAEININPDEECVEEDNNQDNEAVLWQNEEQDQNESMNNANSPGVERNSDSDESEESVRVSKKIKAKKTGQRQGWTANQSALIEEKFKTFIEKGKYPSGESMKIFLTENNLKRPIATLRSKLQHLIRLKLKNKK